MNVCNNVKTNDDRNDEINYSKTKKSRSHPENRFTDYMASKKAKLLNQFEGAEIEKLSSIFEGVAIHVNGFTRPPIDELKNLMAAHGGIFHYYQACSTTHIIASNLPNVKIKHLGTTPIVKPSWITDSIDFGKLLDFRRYLLYNNQSTTQPKIDFPIVEKTTSSNLSLDDSMSINDKQENQENSSVSSSNQMTVINKSSGIIQKFPTKTASDPNFLEEFYNNSRLHLISTLGAEFKQLVGHLRDISDGNFPGKEKLLATKATRHPKSIPNSLIMHIDMDCFFVSVSLRNHPELKGNPVAITHARSGRISNVRPEQKISREQEFSLYSERLPADVISRVDKIDTHSSMSEIASCSYEARICGIKNGMFLGQAVKMCPDLKTLPYDFEGIKEVSHALYEIIASYTLDIEAVSCDEMYVDITAILKQTNMSVEEWASHIRNEIMTITRCPCSTGFGTNRLQARLATRKAKPGGQYYLKPEDVESYFVEVPLTDLPGVGRATMIKLQKLGLNTCGDVQRTSLKVLQSEIGQKAGEVLKEQSLGVDKMSLNFYHERKSVSAEVNYGIRFKTLPECYNFLQSLSNEVYNRLNDIDMSSRRLTLKLSVRSPEAPVETAKFLGCGVCDSLTKSTTSNMVLNNPQIIFKEAQNMYEKLGVNFVELRGMGLQLTKLEKNAPLNKALTNFLNQFRDKEIVKSETKVDFQDKTLENVTNNKEELVCENQQEETHVSGSSKRGRPRGSKSSNGNITTKKSISYVGLNKYFKKVKNEEHNPKSIQSFRAGVEIDINVLNELPEDLRREIIKEYSLETKINTRKAEPVSQINGQIKKCDSDPSKKSPANESPFTNLSWDEIKPIIRKWTQSEENPYAADTEMLAEHLKQLAIDRKIDTLMSVFNFLYRVLSAFNCNWHNAYFKIVNITQEGMVARYGKTLLVKRDYKCCRM